MMKKFAIGLFALALAVTAAGCSSEEKAPEEAAAQQPAAEEATQPAAEEAAEDPAVEQLKAVNSVAIAEDKVNTLFHHDALEDGTPILNPTTGTPEAAKTLLLGYFDEAVADKIIAHYVTAPATDAGQVVTADPFITSSLVGVATTDLTIEGSKADGFKIATKDGVTYTVVWNDEKSRYVVSNIE